MEKNIRSWASARIISRGRDYYRKGRVLSLESFESGKIMAEVEAMTSERYKIEIQFDQWGMPVSKCACPFHWEPLCKHAVAVLIAWQQEETGSEAVLSGIPAESNADGLADSDYIEEVAQLEKESRRIRCTEQGLRIVRKPNRGFLGTYSVSSGNPTRKDEVYQVTVRDAQWEHASCTCIDYKINELGTCKHIERVRLSLGKTAGASRLQSEEERSRQLSVYLGSRPSHKKLPHPAEEIRFHVPPSIRRQAPTWLAQVLDAESYLRNGVSAEKQKEKFGGLLRRLAAKGIKADIDPAVHDALTKESQSAQWERRISGIAKDPAGHPAWKNSVGRMNVKLHPYQAEGILFAAGKRRVFIGDDMGLGKTIQAIGTSLLLRELGQVRQTLVVTPASLKQQWQAEIAKACGESATVIAGSARLRVEQYRKARSFFIILNYELLYRDMDAIVALKPDLVVLDEAQRIKNWETKIAQAIKRLQSPCRLVLTGTPLENKLSELQSISEFLNPKALGAPWKLLPTYATLNAEDKIIGYTRLDHLRQRLGRFLIRRTRQEVLAQLPRRTDNNFWTSITSRQQDVHDELSSQVTRLMNKWKKYKRLTKEDLRRLFTLLTCMRIVCNAYGQYDWKAIEGEVLGARHLSSDLKEKIGSPKLEEFRKIMADLLAVPGQKIVVFSQWERMIRLAELYVRDILETSQSRSVIFSGALSLKKRGAEIRRFNEDPATRVFFSTDAGGVGLNLQHAANCVVNLEIPWNPSVLEQRVGRVHRMGQKKSVSAINLISSECIEERVFNLVAQKKALFSGVFDEETVDIRFSAGQTASFLDKMKSMFPESGAPGKNLPNDEAPPLEAVSDSVAKVEPNELQQQTVGSPAADIASALGSIRVSQDGEELRLSLPKPAIEALKGFKPLFEALLKLAA
ncbi:MAG: SNF2-related protein [Elusimicrobiota bacterium]